TESWTIVDQADVTDLLTTHPYVYFTPHCDHDPITTLRSCLHSAAETRMYADIGGKPCLIEEIGTLGPAMASESVSAAFLRTALFSGWAHDGHGLLWWCGFDQDGLAQAPYDWNALECELGLFRADGSGKPVAEEFSAFRRFCDALPFETLPPRRREAVCLLGYDQDAWAAAYSTFVLAKQAGFDIEFQHASQPLRDAELYLMPSIAGQGPIHRARWLALLERVHAGATLYISWEDGFLPRFEALTSLRVHNRSRRRQTEFEVDLNVLDETLHLTVQADRRIELEAVGATVLGAESDSRPIFARADYGNGRVFFLGFPLEIMLARQPGAFHGPAAQPFWKLYAHMALESGALAGRIVTKSTPHVGVTEHELSSGRRVVILINYAPEPLRETLRLQPGWTVAETLHGTAPASAGQGLWTCAPAANDAVVLIVRGPGTVS
ncbi:MAG: beta-mannanase, partial [Lentisphaerae bacterium]|nr:beta-mannanase [Lentisphaerota bacterium]